MKEFSGRKIFSIGGKSSNIVTILAGAVAGSGICYGLFQSGILRAPSSLEAQQRQTGDVNDSRASERWTASELTKNHEAAIRRSQELVRRFKNETGAPGVVVGVSVDGRPVWTEGFGYADLENGTPCHSSTAMRIASISKPITMALLAKMWEEGQVDMDKPVQAYVPNFPSKSVNGEEVTITPRQLASHTSGIRHYAKKGDVSGKDSTSAEFYIKERYNKVENSLELFKNDELLFKPGTSFEYTTHGYTLLSAVMEKAGNRSFRDMIQDFFKLLGMRSTYLDDVNAIIYNRASYYSKNDKGRLINAELADTSYKWAGGGMVSTVEDLLKFGNAMLYSYQQRETDKSGYLKRSTVSEMWTPVTHTKMSWDKGAGYGLGWVVVPQRSDIGGVEPRDFYIGHGGGAVGASSILLIVPGVTGARRDSSVPSGVSVAMLTNLQDVSCLRVARKIADEFR